MAEHRVIGRGPRPSAPAPAPQAGPLEAVPQWVDPTQTTAPSPELIAPPPASVSPSEWVASEGTLIRMLCRHYGWIQPEVGTLVRFRRAS